MLSVSELANSCGLSRTSVLYYERAGLLAPRFRSSNGYRWYGNEEIECLKRIMAYRSFGVSVADIAELLNNKDQQSQSALLMAQFYNLEKEVVKFKKQQQAIVVMLQEPKLLNDHGLNKEQWVELMISLGFDEDDMIAWHQSFEALKPKAHLEFLQSLGIDEQEISRIQQL
ncbi:MAG: MerR family transcriptional regulator [Oceanospirillaceae bacterium]|nr:MerR family transcriptional regulator [Oceanospirillaceae bacterium]